MPIVRLLAVFSFVCACCAGLCAGEPAPKPAGAEEEIDPDILRKVKKLVQATLSTDEVEREKGWKGLREMGNLAVPGLLALHQKKLATPEMMKSIIIALGDSRDRRAGPVLLEMLASDQKAFRRDAARAIGDSNYKEGQPALEKLAKNDKEDEEVRLHAAIAGAKLGSQECLQALETLYASQSSDVRARAIFALGKFGGVARLVTIEKALSDSDNVVREDAVEALRVIGKKEAWGPLVRAADDREYRIRGQAMEALRQLTQQKIENDPRAWREWWEKSRGQVPEEKEKGKDTKVEISDPEGKLRRVITIDHEQMKEKLEEQQEPEAGQ